MHEAYNKDTFLRCYKYLLELMHGNDDWPKTGNAPLPPHEVTRVPGRSKKSRRREPNEAPKGFSGKGNKPLSNVANVGMRGTTKGNVDHMAKGMTLHKAV